MKNDLPSKSVLINLKKQGLTHRKIANMYNCSPSLISYYLAKEEVFGVGFPPRHVLDYMREKRGMTSQDIFKLFGTGWRKR